MSLAYKVEELLALRDSVSESAVSIDKFADEEVIKGQYPSLTPSLLTSLHFSTAASMSCWGQTLHLFSTTPSPEPITSLSLLYLLFSKLTKPST
jgi:hypothetical protein